ncbi:MAG TPA: PAS-domain containing protein, partial [Pseudolabrys sp.]|nr:PAS-domain containing protein [Pseudolabrys sp.]
MPIKKLIQTARADAGLPSEVRAALVESLFAPLASLAVGAGACSIIGTAVALRVGDPWIMLNSVAILAVGMLRVVSAAHYKRQKRIGELAGIRLWEYLYEYGAWGFSALLGSLCWMTITRTSDASLQMAVTTTAAGYAAAISGRNAGRPFIAIGQLTLTSLPMAIALLVDPDWLHKVLGFVVLLFVYGMMDITLSIRDVIIQALTMTRKEAALAARFEEQAKRFDVALNNMSHGLCMLDQRDRLMVWNARFLELLDLEDAPISVGMSISELARYAIRTGHYDGNGIKHMFSEIARSLQQQPQNQIQFAPNDKRTIALSRRIMPGGGAVIILEDISERIRAQ